MPGQTSDPSRWTGPFSIDRSFGYSGAADFLLQLHRITRDVAHLELGRRMVDDIVARARNGETMHWILPRYRFQGRRGEPASFTGYRYGAAGLGLLLLQMHHSLRGGSLAIVLPDDPFGVSAR